MTVFTTEYRSPLGTLTLASDAENLTGLWIEGQKHFGSALCGERIRKDDLPVFEAVRNWLDDYFAGKQPAIDSLPLAPMGTPFRRQVWAVLREIPYGQTVTYGDIARQLGAGCAQAVGGAVGHNPISIIVPCHRVMGAGNKLTGYDGGIDKKLWLLRHEGIDTSALK